jgi:DNA-binding transcriptional ArsR family regulator
MARKRKRASSRRKATPPGPEQMVKAFGHPVRVRVLAILIDRIAGPKAIAEELDMNLSNVSYHLRVLQKAELVEIAEEEPVRGAIAHFYSAVWPEETRAVLEHFNFDLPTG